MAIGTSLGAYFEDELHFHMHSFNSNEDADGSADVYSPNPRVMKDNNELDSGEFTEKNALRDPAKPAMVSDEDYIASQMK